jgi:hypothetical protein
MSIYVHAKSHAELVLEVCDGTNSLVLYEEPRSALMVPLTPRLNHH